MDVFDDDHLSQIDYGFIAVSLSSKIFMVESFAPVPMVKNHATYTYDDNDRLLTEGGFSYGYDNNGNLLSKTGNGEQHNFTYNALNQLVHAEINTDTDSSTVDYVYDHDGNRPFDSAQDRAGKTINGTDVFTYIVDKNRPYAKVLEEQWSNGALSATTGYVYGDALLSRIVTHPYPSQEGTRSPGTIMLWTAN